MKTKILIRSAIVTLAILLIPFAAMRFSSEVNWSVSDFVIMGALVFTTTLAFNLAAASRGNMAYRAAACLAIAATFLLIWVNLAVGIIGSGPNYANLMYGGMALVGIAGAIMSDFRAQGMARTMFTMTLAQIAVPVIAFAIFQFQRVQGEQFEDAAVVVGVTGFFSALWLTSALLFNRSAATSATEAG